MSYCIEINGHLFFTLKDGVKVTPTFFPRLVEKLNEKLDQCYCFIEDDLDDDVNKIQTFQVNACKKATVVYSARFHFRHPDMEKFHLGLKAIRTELRIDDSAVLSMSDLSTLEWRTASGEIDSRTIAKFKAAAIQLFVQNLP